ncbi:MAG TPA: quinone-dependent dihydroorotate dehydrogenase [Alistipes sp.]|nr:quinone-dependent dihydroorotate dehydrogenase [Alistipes sp.]
MYHRIIKPILFSLSIERAHRAVLGLLRLAGLIPGGRWLLGKCWAVRHPALEREVFGIKFSNPVGLAAGFDRDAEAFRELAAMGFGFVEVGTVTPRPQQGNPRPRVFRLPKDRAIVNRIGLSNRGLEHMIRQLRRPHEGVIVGCNIGKNTATPPDNGAADYLRLFRNLYQYADYFTVNISCDNGGCEHSSHTPEHILRILDPLFDFRRGQNQYRPILLKISPDLTDPEIDRITDLMLESPLDGIVATNGTHLRQGLRTSRAAVERIGNGRLSGAPLNRRAVEVVRRIRQRSGNNYPIIGSGGLMSADDVRAMLDAGASLVQLYTGYVYEGPALLKKICRSLIANRPGAASAAEAAPKPPAERKLPESAVERKAAPSQEPAASAPPEPESTSGYSAKHVSKIRKTERPAPKPARHGQVPSAGQSERKRAQSGRIRPDERPAQKPVQSGPDTSADQPGQGPAHPSSPDARQTEKQA